MKKTVLLLISLWLSHFAEAQKMVYVGDSTALKQYFGSIRQVVTVGADKKVTTSTQTFIQNPAQQTSRPPGGRVTRDDDAAIFRKELSAANRHINWSAVSNDFSSINYRCYLDAEGKIDSVVYYLTIRDTTQNRNRIRFYDSLGEIPDAGFRKDMEAKWMKVIRKFNDVAAVNPRRTLTGALFTRSNIKDLEAFLKTQKDTITTINLTDYTLEEFPHQLKRFRNLKTIILKDNYIRSATLDKKDYPKLNMISFQNNLLRDGTLKFTSGLKPTTINLSDNHFTRIPYLHRKVKYLFLANSSISEVTTRDVRKIRKVQFLNLYANTITTVTPKIARMKKLKELDLYRNQLTALPSHITRMKNLETLAISYNEIGELPAGIHAMRGLKTLYTHHNKLSMLPPLPENLETLDVGHNHLQNVSTQVLPLKKLKSLDYSYNQVAGNLDFLLELPHIKEIYLMENRYAGSEEEEVYFSRIFTTLVSRGVAVK